MVGFVSASMPIYIKYINYISPLRWSGIILTNVIFRDVTFNCSKDELDNNGKCPFQNGEQVIDIYHMNSNLRRDLYVLGIVTFGFFVISVLATRIKAYQISR